MRGWGLLGVTRVNLPVDHLSVMRVNITEGAAYICTRSGTHTGFPRVASGPHRPCLPPLSWHLTSLPPHWLPVAMPTSQVTSMIAPVLISDTGWLCVYLPANSTDKSDCWR